MVAVVFDVEGKGQAKVKGPHHHQSTPAPELTNLFDFETPAKFKPY